MGIISLNHAGKGNILEAWSYFNSRWNGNIPTKSRGKREYSRKLLSLIRAGMGIFSLIHAGKGNILETCSIFNSREKREYSRKLFYHSLTPKERILSKAVLSLIHAGMGIFPLNHAAKGNILENCSSVTGFRLAVTVLSDWLFTESDR